MFTVCRVDMMDLGLFFEQSLSQVLGFLKLHKKDLGIYFSLFYHDFPDNFLVLH